MVKHNDIVTRNGNLFHVKKQNDGHWTLALLMMGVAVTPYRRMAKNKIESLYRVTEKDEQIKKSKLFD